MWQQFTEHAQRAVYFAQVAAEKNGEDFVDAEHLLIGLLQDQDNSACKLLHRLAISPARLHTELSSLLPPGPGRTRAGMLLTRRGKTTVNLAYEEAVYLGNNYIGTEHLLLGLIREGSRLSGQVLQALLVTRNQVHNEARQLQAVTSQRQT